MNITKMIIFSSFLNIIGQTPYIVYYILSHSIYTPTQLYDLYNVSLIIIYFGSSLDIFIFYFFNKLYRKILIAYFNFLFWNKNFCFK